MKKPIALTSAALCLLGLFTGAASAITSQTTTINGLKVLNVQWTDSKGMKRSVALKLEGNGNPGHGGYAVQATYRFVSGGKTYTRTINPSASGDGFGYFVSHERERLFADGSTASIANKIFHVDDSPLGRGFAVTVTQPTAPAGSKIIRFATTYSHYGTINANGINADTGEDKPPLPTSQASFKKYAMPVTIDWSFQDGKDYPRIRNIVSLANVPGPDRVSFDVRGPYGKLNFDSGNNVISQVRWGDRFLFVTTSQPLTRNSTWTGNATNKGARYSSLIAGGYEMGLIEPRLFSKSALNDGYSDARGKTSDTYNDGNGCSSQTQLMPCDYEWPYQSAQYELPYNNQNAPTTSEKMAWGSTPYYGTSLTSTWDGTTGTPFNGFPASRKLTYDVCLVLGKTVTGGLTSKLAAAGGDYNCAAGAK
ncbi:hypothetical protein [Oryzibacter oryziterrae]|uniref:hypothetical protein n=1 Tax=Oryzibacter oryziterrae TaxID=2766474 RepID=UPI001F1F4308|nr:hypothetical protein [Oryzibacter oryziterrae]